MSDYKTMERLTADLVAAGLDGWSLTTVSWDDAERGAGSVFGANITDVSAKMATGHHGMKLISSHMNPSRVAVKLSEMLTQVETADGFETISLDALLAGAGRYFEPAGVAPGTDLSGDEDRADLQVEMLFVPVAEGEEGTEYGIEAKNYQAVDGNPRNVRFLCTAVGTSATEEKHGRQLLLPERLQDGELRSCWLRAEATDLKSGEAESAEAAAAAAAAGKGAARPVGHKNWPPAMHRQLFVQVPVEQEEVHVGAGAWAALAPGGEGGEVVYRSLGAVTQARVCKGSDAGAKERFQKQPVRERSKRPLVTCTLVYTYPEGSVPAAADVAAAVAEMNDLLESAGTKKRLMDSDADFVTGAFTPADNFKMQAALSGASTAQLTAAVEAAAAQGADLVSLPLPDGSVKKVGLPAVAAQPAAGGDADVAVTAEPVLGVAPAVGVAV